MGVDYLATEFGTIFCSNQNDCHTNQLTSKESERFHFLTSQGSRYFFRKSGEIRLFVDSITYLYTNLIVKLGHHVGAFYSIQYVTCHNQDLTFYKQRKHLVLFPINPVTS